MKTQTLLLINGAESRGVAQGQLSQTLIELASNELQNHFNILQTTVADGYNVREEQEKFKQADVVLFQYPVFWFSVPAGLKAYMDEVYEHGVFFEGSDRYGEGGLLRGKRYLLSTTWNAPEEAFLDKAHFFDGRLQKEVLVAMHKAQQYVGMRPLASFAAFDVVANPRLDKLRESWRRHLHQELIKQIEPESTLEIA
ncbi:NAD(P)H-dependent oxidoreductase [Maricurvus nonylphenolicus]|uniref:NAD(P)H-dependent oxidoreductase n=1 Tax=Maricurvus nonylphenolicus TaxID=1008307 RepID=UPI0036F3616C